MFVKNNEFSWMPGSSTQQRTQASYQKPLTIPSGKVLSKLQLPMSPKKVSPRCRHDLTSIIKISPPPSSHTLPMSNIECPRIPISKRKILEKALFEDVPRAETMNLTTHRRTQENVPRKEMFVKNNESSWMPGSSTQQRTQALHQKPLSIPSGQVLSKLQIPMSPKKVSSRSRRHDLTLITKNVFEPTGGRPNWDRAEEEDMVAAKKFKLSEDYMPALPPPYISQYEYPYYAWYDPYARSAFKPFHTIHNHDEKPQYRDRIPAYLNHDPPVLLHPERVVPMSESERFEISYQPNVALAPRSTIDNRRTEMQPEIVRTVEEKTASVTKHKRMFHPEIELSTDTDDSASEHHETGTAVEQVAAVFNALSDAKETTRQLVVGLVKRLASRLDSIEAENKRLMKDNVSLLQQIKKAKESRTKEGMPLTMEHEENKETETDLNPSCSDVKPVLIDPSALSDSPYPASHPVLPLPLPDIVKVEEEEQTDQNCAPPTSDGQTTEPGVPCDKEVIVGFREVLKEQNRTVVRSSPVSVITSPASIKVEPPSE